MASSRCRKDWSKLCNFIFELPNIDRADKESKDKIKLFNFSYLPRFNRANELALASGYAY
jgi:hypothetical protein